MRRPTPLVLALAVVAAACGSGSDNGSGSAAASTTTVTTPSITQTTTTMAPSTTTMAPTTTATTTTTVPIPVFLSTEGNVTTGQRDSETVFTLTHDATRFDDIEPISLDSPGHRGAMWVTVEGVRRSAEIHRLWPPDEAVDVIWLTSRSETRSETLLDATLFDALTLEGQLDEFGLHADCRTAEGDFGVVALLFFGGDTPQPLIAWGVDREAMRFVEREPVSTELGDCLAVAPRE